MSIGFLLGICATAIWMVILITSERTPETRRWPPRQGNLVTALWAWGLTALIYLGLAQTWGQASLLTPAMRYGFGLPLVVLGGGLHAWATATLGLKGTSGWDVGLVTTGPYALCRHPQYLGQIISLFGLAALIGSADSLNLGVAASAMLLYGSGVEDRALAARHPGLFASYRAKTPFLLPSSSRS